MFAKSLKAPTGNFDIPKYLSLTAGSTRSSAQGKPKHVTMPNKKVRYTDFLAFGMLSLPLTCLYWYLKAKQVSVVTLYLNLDPTTLVDSTILFSHVLNALTFPTLNLNNI